MLTTQLSQDEFDKRSSFLYFEKMYDYLQGKLKSITPEYAVIDVNGIGYRVLIPVSLYTSSTSLQGEIFLYTSFVVRDDSMRLFGFATKDERDFFEKLCGISGIGVKTALSLIGHMESATLKVAIQTGNSTLLSKIPGIGKKTAERIIVELGDRIHKWKTSEKTPSTTFSDALTALINLGYNQTQAQKAIQKTLDEHKDEPPLPLLITAALKHT